MSQTRKRSIRRPDPQNKPPSQGAEDQGQVFQLQIFDGFGAADAPVTAKNRVRQRIVVHAMAPERNDSLSGVSTPSVEWTEAATIGTWAKVFGVHRNTMSGWLRRKLIKHRKLGSLYQIAVEELPARPLGKNRVAR